MGYYASVAFDVTCAKGNPSEFDNEVIKLSASVIDATDGEVLECWESLVSPMNKLTKYCTQRTGITQKQVNAAKSMSEVMVQFDSWIMKKTDGQFQIVTDGHAEMIHIYWNKIVIKKKLVEATEYAYMRKWINIKKTFANEFECEKMGLKKMARQLKTEETLSAVVSRLVKKGAVLSQYDYAPHCVREGGEEMKTVGDQLTQPFDYYLVVDFECTCDKKGPSVYNHEIIEFPVVVICSKTNEIVDKFHSYVRPVINPQLSDFCKELTGITQKQVDSAPILSNVLLKMDSWLKEKDYLNKKICFAADCVSDLQDFYWTQSVTKQKVIPEDAYSYLRKWCDIGKLFKEVFKTNRTHSLKGMLKLLGLSFEGRTHSGIDDASNIARVLLKIIEKGGLADANDCFKKSYYGVLSFQTTSCKTGGSRKCEFTKEIIDMAITVVDASSAKLIDVFQTYVRPESNKKLTTHCMNTLMVSQEQINNSPSLQEAYVNMTKWLEDHDYYSSGGHPFTIISSDSEVHNLAVSRDKFVDPSLVPFLFSWIDLQKAFSLVKWSFFTPSKPSIKRMLSSLNMTPYGDCDSSKNISINSARVVNLIIREGGPHKDSFDSLVD